MTVPAPSAGRVDLLRWQFDLTWSLFEYHLERLEPEDFLWEPGPLCWTVRRSPEGAWVPDWADSEPDPVPVPTVAWVSWHIGWWWSVTLDHARGERPRERTEGRVARRGRTHDRLAPLPAHRVARPPRHPHGRRPGRPGALPWPADPSRTKAHMLAWVNAELMKNATEIGQLRLLRAAS